MTVQPNRHGRVAIIVTAREYQALLSADVALAAQFEGEDPSPEDRADMRALDTLLLKCKDAGIRYEP